MRRRHGHWKEILDFSVAGVVVIDDAALEVLLKEPRITYHRIKIFSKQPKARVVMAI